MFRLCRPTVDKVLINPLHVMRRSESLDDRAGGAAAVAATAVSVKRGEFYRQSRTELPKYRYLCTDFALRVQNATKGLTGFDSRQSLMVSMPSVV